MKKILVLFLSLPFLFAKGQFEQIEKITSDTILADDNHFLKNPYDEKLLLIGDFLPVKEGSEIKLAKVLTENGWGYINKKGKTIIPPSYYHISEFKNGLARMTYLIPNQFDKWKQDQCLGFINYEGKRVTTKCVRVNAGVYDIGNQSDGFDYLRLNAYDETSEPFFPTKTKGLVGIFDIHGKNVIPEKYHAIRFDGKYFICEQEDRGVFDIYDKSVKLIRTIKANNVTSLFNDFIVVRKNWKEHIENILTGEKYLENIFNSIHLSNQNNDLSSKKIMMTGTTYEDGKSGKVKSVSYINHDFKIISESSYPKLKKILGKEDLVIAESSDDKNILFLDSDWKILKTFEKKEFSQYEALSSNGFQKTENLQQNLKKYYQSWSRFSMTGNNRDLGYYNLLE